MPSKLARFTDRCVALSQKAVGSDGTQPVKKGEGGYADWVIISLHGLREYLDLLYRRLLDILREMPDIVAKLDLSVEELPDFTTVCVGLSEKSDLSRAMFGSVAERISQETSGNVAIVRSVEAIDQPVSQMEEPSQ